MEYIIPENEMPTGEQIDFLVAMTDTLISVATPENIRKAKIEALKKDPLFQIIARSTPERADSLLDNIVGVDPKLRVDIKNLLVALKQKLLLLRTHL